MKKEAGNMETILKETIFTMEAEGFTLTTEDKNVLQNLLENKISYAEQRQIYIERAKLRGGTTGDKQRVSV